MTRESDVTTDPALVVGTPKAKTASLHRNSRMLERKTFRPSACLKKHKGQKLDKDLKERKVDLESTEWSF